MVWTTRSSSLFLVLSWFVFFQVPPARVLACMPDPLLCGDWPDAAFPLESCGISLQLSMQSLSWQQGAAQCHVSSAWQYQCCHLRVSFDHYTSVFTSSDLLFFLLSLSVNQQAAKCHARNACWSGCAKGSLLESSYPSLPFYTEHAFWLTLCSVLPSPLLSLICLSPSSQCCLLRGWQHSALISTAVRSKAASAAQPGGFGTSQRAHSAASALARGGSEHSLANLPFISRYV